MSMWSSPSVKKTSNTCWLHASIALPLGLPSRVSRHVGFFVFCGTSRLKSGRGMFLKQLVPEAVANGINGSKWTEKSGNEVALLLLRTE